jgi:hypothetical protein
MIRLGFRGMRWANQPLELGVEFATTAHNCYRRNNTLEPMKRGAKHSEKSDVDFLFARSFYRHHDLIIATDARTDFAGSMSNRDTAKRLYYVKDGRLKYLPKAEIVSNYPTNLDGGYNAGVDPPLSYDKDNGFPGNDYESCVIANNQTLPLDNEGNLIENPEYTETAFTYAYVNKYGEESAPGVPSNLIKLYKTNDSNAIDTVILEGLRQSADPNVVGIRIYSVIDGEYFMLGGFGETIQATATTGEVRVTKKAGEYGRVYGFGYHHIPGDLLVSTTWAPPPSGVKHLAQLENGLVILADDTTLYLNEPQQMHAFPVDYRFSVTGTIQRIARIANGVAVLTDQATHFYVGTTPENFQQLPQSFPYPITDPDSLAEIDGAHVYVCAEGIALISVAGGEIITDGWIDINEWQERVTLDSARLALYEGRVVMTTRNPATSLPIGYVFNLREQDITSFSLSETALQAGFWRDAYSGKTLYVGDGTGLSVFNDGDEVVTCEYETGDIVIPRAVLYTACKCEADAYPGTSITIKPENAAQFQHTPLSSQPFRIKPTGRARRMRVRIETSQSVADVAVTETARQL